MADRNENNRNNSKTSDSWRSFSEDFTYQYHFESNESQNCPKFNIIVFIKLATFIFHCRYQKRRFRVIKTILVMVNKKKIDVTPGSDAIKVKRAPEMCLIILENHQAMKFSANEIKVFASCAKKIHS